MALQDVIVTIDPFRPSAKTGFGKLMILAEKAGESKIKNYANIEEVAKDFSETTNAYKKAAAFFEQKDEPQLLSIATYDPTSLEAPLTVKDAIEKYYDEDWYFVITADALLTDQLAVADFIEGRKFKQYVVKTTDPESRNAFKVKEYSRIQDFYHPFENEEPDAALIGAVGNLQPGTITWKFKTLKGITPLKIAADELKRIHEDGANVYVTKSGEGQTSEGIVVSGEYIDVIHGMDWIKYNIEHDMQETFRTNDKISFRSGGISLLETDVINVLERAAEFGIVNKDDEDESPLYTVTAKPKSEMPEDEVRKRIYSGLSFSYEPEDAIHMTKIHGEIRKGV